MMYLTDDTLGRLDVGPIVVSPPTGCRTYYDALRQINPDGFIVTDFVIGAPNPRDVVYPRALAHGTVDDSRYVGSRAISANVLLDANKRDPQDALDAIGAYLNPRRDRPRLNWSLPGSQRVRSAVVRGSGSAVSVSRANLHAIPLQFVAPLGVIESPDESIVTINPATDVEVGRTYDLTFDRTYPPGLGLGDRIVTNDGTADADWIATIFGPCTNPTLSINGVDITFDRVGGLALTAGVSLVIDSRERTILLNGDPAESRYDKVNFTAWSWDDVRLGRGSNVVRYESAGGVEGSVQFRWRSAWL